MFSLFLFFLLFSCCVSTICLILPTHLVIREVHALHIDPQSKHHRPGLTKHLWWLVRVSLNLILQHEIWDLSTWTTKTPVTLHCRGLYFLLSKYAYIIMDICCSFMAVIQPFPLEKTVETSLTENISDCHW